MKKGFFAKQRKTGAGGEGAHVCPDQDIGLECRERKGSGEEGSPVRRRSKIVGDLLLTRTFQGKDAIPVQMCKRPLLWPFSQALHGHLLDREFARYICVSADVSLEQTGRRGLNTEFSFINLFFTRQNNSEIHRNEERNYES